MDSFRERGHTLMQRTVAQRRFRLRKQGVVLPKISLENLRDLDIPLLGLIPALFIAILLVLGTAIALQEQVPFWIGVVGSSAVLALTLYGFIRISLNKK